MTTFTAEKTVYKNEIFKDTGISVRVEAFVDGKSVWRWAFVKSHEGLANRLVKAIESGKIFKYDPKGYTINAGRKDEVIVGPHWTINILSRILNAELKKYGF